MTFFYEGWWHNSCPLWRICIYTFNLASRHVICTLPDLYSNHKESSAATHSSRTQLSWLIFSAEIHKDECPVGCFSLWSSVIKRVIVRKDHWYLWTEFQGTAGVWIMSNSMTFRTQTQKNVVCVLLAWKATTNKCLKHTENWHYVAQSIHRKLLKAIMIIKDMT